MQARGSDRLRLLAAGLAAGLATASGTWAEGTLEAAVKATDLYKFAAFVAWPAAAAGAGGTLQLCLAGDDPFGALIDQAVRGQQVGGRAIVLVRLDRVDRGVPCQILFVAPSRRQAVAEALDQVRGAPVLTVTDAADDPAHRGMIDFVLRDNRVRFRIDPHEAAQSGLSISSKLLSLAVKP